jgi:hypothetical protein
VAPPPPPERGWPEEIALAPPPPLDLGKRGFFEGDSSRLEITVVDRATMSPRRVKVVESKDDPRDAEAMRALVDRALSDPGGWEELPLAPAAPPAHPL